MTGIVVLALFLGTGCLASPVPGFERRSLSEPSTPASNTNDQLKCLCKCVEPQASAGGPPTCKCKCFAPGTATNSDDIKTFLDAPQSVDAIIADTATADSPPLPSPIPSAIIEKFTANGDSAAVKQQKEATKTQQIDYLIRAFNGNNDAAEAAAEENLKAIQAAKEAIHAHFGLKNIAPADNGYWEGDILLTTAQALNIKAKYQPGKTNSTRSKRSGFDVTKAPYFLWETFPIRYYVVKKSGICKLDIFLRSELCDPADDEAAIISAAFKHIQDTTKCITFKEVAKSPFSKPLIKVKKGFASSKPPGCSTESLLGQAESGINPIFVGDLQKCSNKDAATAAVIHGILHTLGVRHTHTRTDRDKSITVNWENVDLSEAHAFDVDTTLSSDYNTTYDYKSIMHVSASAFGKTDSSNTITTTDSSFQATIGKATQLSDQDIQLLNGMYCNTKFAFANEPDTLLTIPVKRQDQSFDCDCLCNDKLYRLEAALKKQDFKAPTDKKTICGCNCYSGQRPPEFDADLRPDLPSRQARRAQFRREPAIASAPNGLNSFVKELLTA